MEASGVILFYDKCRLCLDKAGVCDITKTEHLIEDILVCTGVKVSPSDNLPQKICSKCFEIVQNANELRLLATKNDIHLKSLFSNDSDEEGTLVIAEESLGLQVFEQTVNTTHPLEPEKKCKKKVGINSSNISDDTNQKPKRKMLKIRKDLFDASQTNSSTVRKTKKDYENNKKNKMLEREVYTCEICKKETNTPKKLYLHMRSHNKKLSCPLDGCQKMFATRGDMERHLRTHTGVRPYVCDVCDKSFTQQGTLKCHKKSVHYDLSPDCPINGD